MTQIIWISASGGYENVIMAASMAEGKTIIEKCCRRA